MNTASLKRQVFLSFILAIFSLCMFVFATYAWFTGKYQTVFNAEMGFVQADLDVYFMDEYDNRVEATEVEIAEGVYKPGVYLINVVSSSADNHFENLRICVNVSSDVETYIRVKIYEQLTLTYENYDGSLTELSVLTDGYMAFNYDFDNWYDNRIMDDYIYYKYPVERVNSSTPLEIGLITSYFTGESFANYSPGYSLQIGFSIEAVQADGGPENVWNLPTPPWGSTW